MPELNLYRAQFRVARNQKAWAWVRACDENDAEDLLDVVYGGRLVDYTVEQVTESSLKTYKAKVRLSRNSVVLTEICAEDKRDAARHLTLLYGEEWKFA